MQDFTGKTAFVTGGASGIGFAMAKAFLEAGMNVMLADIEAKALAAALKSLAVYDNRLGGIVLDVSLRDAYEKAAAETFAKFGKVHIVCNNAGVSRAGAVDKVSPADWEWVWGVNLRGTVTGIQIFLPHIKAHGEGGHIVNTASMSGLVGNALSGVYASTKYAIVGISEVLAEELKGSGIGVSVLCPAVVHTNMPMNGRNRTDRFGGALDITTDPTLAERNARFLAANAAGLDPDRVAPMVLRAIRENRLFIVTDPARREIVAARHARLMAAFDASVDDLAKSAPR
ncbi:MAG TPA: SDR family NAD(P)-dependent oxidoreductase [Stellaceae bacterium]|jgi:NAD(P)-dependent dehydrogenase (short-subunit alcohol dehydrogenase family)|nr:SDR family NAD(P)-dependent oxidoreductase [Stellaceae bacterium]